MIKSLKEGVLCCWCIIKVYGIVVGLLSDVDMGNSEVGYNVMGVGKII